MKSIPNVFRKAFLMQAQQATAQQAPCLRLLAVDSRAEHGLWSCVKTRVGFCWKPCHMGSIYLRIQDELILVQLFCTWAYSQHEDIGDMQTCGRLMPGCELGLSIAFQSPSTSQCIAPCLGGCISLCRSCLPSLCCCLCRAIF